MTSTAAARSELYDALAAAFAGTGVVVARTRPAELATPLVYIDVAERRFADADGAPVVVVTLPVVAIVDGADDEQVAALDDHGDLIWRCALEVKAAPSVAVRADVDADGPRLRGLVTTVDVDVAHLTLCPDPDWS